MANYINRNIVGDGLTASTARGFRAIRHADIGSPVYDSRYFETFPTVWATAYAFGRELIGDGTNAAAVEEWATLFLLHFFGAVHLVTFSQTELQNHQLYDGDLWLALSGTYPKLPAQHELDGLHLLETEAGTVVGAYYPDTVFFPSRRRSAWREDSNLQPYLSVDGNRLSWTLSSEQLIKTEHDRESFREHLQLIAYYALPNKVGSPLLSFCDREFPTRANAVRAERPERTLARHPGQWTEIPGNQEPTKEQLLEAYPLRKEKPDGGYIYFLVDKMPQHEAWMETMKSKPYHYVAADSNHIVVQHRRTRTIPCELRLGLDEIVQLETLFLDDKRTAPYWSAAPTKTEAYVSLINALHRSDVADPRVTQGDKVTAAFLAPINQKFLSYFSDVPLDAGTIGKTVTTDQSGKVVGVDWKFTLLGRVITWRTKPLYSADLKSSSLAIYPPQTSTQWHLYAAHGVGDKLKCGRWNLVDEHGIPGKLLAVEEDDEYVSVLQGSGKESNRPRYLMLTDSEEHERGVLIIAGLTDVSTQPRGFAQLAMDFGTSNTCLASRNGKSAVLQFSLAPERLWGAGTAHSTPPLGDAPLLDSAREQAGFVPFAWGGEKGYFPTVLLSRKSDPELTETLAPKQLTLKHLFEVDIPGLHKGLEERLNDGAFNQLWNVHWDLKWGQSEPWRTLFLQLLMLYAHAEIFFNNNAILSGYAFTFPLAFDLDNQSEFHRQAQDVLRQIRHYCYGTKLIDAVPAYVSHVDESTAIALAHRIGDDPNTIDVFIDIGGGSTDYAVRHNTRLLVLDSVKVAGRTFFEFGEKNLDPALSVNGAAQFRRHLGKLLQGRDNAEFSTVNLNRQYPLSVTYSVGINALDNAEFGQREAALLQHTMGDFSYQQYRTQLFFRHILAYGLLQVCAAVVSEKLKLSSGVNLILSGNGWGLLLFADVSRRSTMLGSEATFVLDLLKRELTPTLDEAQQQSLEALKISQVWLLNKENLSVAKTSVALGALSEIPRDPQSVNLSPDQGASIPGTIQINDESNSTQNGKVRRNPFAGVSVKNLSINGAPPQTIHWYERWGMDEFKQKFGAGNVNISSATFEMPADTERPLDVTLGVLTQLGNFSGGEKDRLPPSEWKSMNNELGNQYVRRMSGRNVQGTPVNYFVSNVLYAQDSSFRDFLDELAKVHGHYKK